MSALTCPSCLSRSLETHRVGSWRLLSVCACGVVYEGEDQHSLHIVLDGRRRAPHERGGLIGRSAVGDGGVGDGLHSHGF
jgi:hypothetical protein